MTTVDEQLVHFNGVDAESGEDLFPAMKLVDLCEAGARRDWRRRKLVELKAIAAARSEPHFAPAAFVNPSDLSQTGWGVLFAYDEDPKVIEALRPLLDHRKQQTGDRLYYEYASDEGWQADEDKYAFLVRKQIYLHGQVDPRRRRTTF
ncbi:hypothetical protein [Nannocystis sp.]|uniref:hypothetical protein n=1 Tax=Nannocystis sp. TaxID=1962667 RepID=UPI0025F681DF|nr:hypothetical protein [Nannocystis sp.]MBK7828403.1 hypothetical protein [Nannocystis sp.]